MERRPRGPTVVARGLRYVLPATRNLCRTQILRRNVSADAPLELRSLFAGLRFQPHRPAVMPRPDLPAALFSTDPDSRASIGTVGPRLTDARLVAAPALLHLPLVSSMRWSHLSHAVRSRDAYPTRRMVDALHSPSPFHPILRGQRPEIGGQTPRAPPAKLTFPAHIPREIRPMPRATVGCPYQNVQEPDDTNAHGEARKSRRPSSGSFDPRYSQSAAALGQPSVARIKMSKSLTTRMRMARLERAVARRAALSTLATVSRRLL